MKPSNRLYHLAFPANNDSMKHRRLSAWLWAALTIALVAGVSATGWYFLSTGSTANGSPKGDWSAGTTDDPSTRPAKLQAGQDYYLFVKLAELRPLRSNGSRWDRVDRSAPDIIASITWQNAIVWKSAKRSDTFIATWDLFRIDVAELLTSGGQIDLESSLNAAMIRVDQNAMIKVDIWDDDAASSDTAGTFELVLTQLVEGENVIVNPGTSVARFIVEAVSRSTPLDQLVSRANRR